MSLNLLKVQSKIKIRFNYTHKNEVNHLEHGGVTMQIIQIQLEHIFRHTEHFTEFL